MLKQTVRIKKLPNLARLPLPCYGTPQSAGVDLYAAIESPITLKPFERKAIPNGIAIALTAGLEAQVRPRSGLAIKYGITVLNTPGTIDADYRGEICTILINMSDSEFVIEPGMRISQMIIAEHKQASWNLVTDLDETERGVCGFGSTGLQAGSKDAV